MNDIDTWLVGVPEYDAEGVVIRRFEVTQREADFDKLRTALNPQRGDRSVDAGTYTRLEVDGVLWMTDTPAEVRDLYRIDEIMGQNNGGSMLIVGLGLGLVVGRAITAHDMKWIDVVEREQRVIDAVGPYYHYLAEQYGCVLNIHHADIHKWRTERGEVAPCWGIGFFDIWPHIDSEDMPEVRRLRNRFRPRLVHFEAWAQDERIAQARRIRTGTGWY